MSDQRKRYSRRLGRIERLEERQMLAGDTFLVNFQNDEATTPTRYLRDTGLVYGDRGDGFFYGWTSDHTDQGRERSLLADQRFDTLVHFEQGQSWEFELANGMYEVTVAVGDPGADDGVHTINVEGVNLINALPDNTIDNFVDSLVVSVADGRLTIDQGAAAEKATRINYVHIVGVAPPGNSAPDTPVVTEPTVDGQIVNPTDVHMEAVGFFDSDGDTHRSTDWEIWTLGSPQEIASHPNDGFIEFRFDGGPWPQVHPESDGGAIANTGEWFGNDGLTSSVFPFQLPDMGAVNNPFTSADFGINLRNIGTSTITNIDLYAVRVDALPDLLPSDFYSGESPDPSATLIQEDFLTPGSPTTFDEVRNNFTNTSGDAALRDYLNAAYNGGAGIGQYVFLRLSYASDLLPNGWDGYQVRQSDSGGAPESFPTLSYTTPGGGELVWQTLGIEGVERLHTHLGDGIFTGPVAGQTELDENTNYELRSRFRDSAGAVSDWATRQFTTGAASTVFAMELRDVSATPVPEWLTSNSQTVELPTGGTPASLRMESAAAGDPMILIEGSPSAGNTFTDSPALADHEPFRLVIEAGSQALTLGETDLTLTGDDQVRTIFLPSINLGPGGRLDLWVDSAGGTYFGTSGQTEPDFSLLARGANLNIPFITNEPGFVIEEVGVDYRLPVNIAFVPDPGPDPDDPLYYVAELYGSIQVVTRDGTKQEFATGLLDYNVTGPISGSGEQGMTGLAVQRNEQNPDVYDLYVGMLWDNGSPPGNSVHYPKVERITSTPGGLSLDTRTVILNMQPEVQGQSHQISNITIGPDGKLYVHNGDGFDASTGLDLDQFRGKVLRMNLDGTAPDDNPFYNAANGINARDYVYAYGLRNPFGGAWRASDGEHYQVENGPSIDRFSKIERGVSYGWDGSNSSMTINAIYNWFPATAPVNITFVQDETFAGSQFPQTKRDHAFVSESGPTYASGPQANGKRISEFELDASGALINGPTSLIDYVGTGRSSVVALAAGPDGLYFSTLYEDSGSAGPTASGARIYRVRYVNPVVGDYDIDGDVDQDDRAVWADSFGSNLLLAADGNSNGVVDAADYTVWRDAFEAAQNAAATATIVAEAVVEEVDEPVVVAYASAEVPADSAPASEAPEVSEPVRIAFASLAAPSLSTATAQSESVIPSEGGALVEAELLLLVDLAPSATVEEAADALALASEESADGEADEELQAAFERLDLAVI